MHDSFPSADDPAATDRDSGVNPSSAPAIGAVIAMRMDRRGMMRSLAATTALMAVPASLAPLASPRQALAATPAATFAEISHGVDDTHHVAPGYTARVLLRWGDPVLPGAPAFDPGQQSPEAQAAQFGYNCDFIAFLPLPFGSRSTERGLLCVNHEYTIASIMFPAAAQDGEARPFLGDPARRRVDIELAAHGVSIVEVARDVAGIWQVRSDGPYNRRITATTPIRIAGPAAGHARLRTAADPSGTRVLGTLNNCAGGLTPWGTYLTAEENFNVYFSGTSKGHPEARNFNRYGISGGWYAWHRHHDRFDIAKEPNEPNRFGWIGEIDPRDPDAMPVKRTALGRLKHEGAMCVLNGDGRVVIYSGDDESAEYVYRFVSDDRFDPADREANRDLLDHGTLSVARFDTDGTVHWLPLIFGSGGLTPVNGFDSQADVLIEARRAADILQATPMDRPEDVEANPRTGKVYVMLSNNRKRRPDDVDAANPRADNEFGHIIEIAPDNGDHAAAAGTWDILVKCGDPARPEIGALWNSATSSDGWFACPDNCAVDSQGRLWIATDQGSTCNDTLTSDGVWSLGTEGDDRGTGRMFFRAPGGAEVCGPCFTPDDRTLFVSIQHPATDGVSDFAPLGRPSTFEEPATRWPDFRIGMPPRPSVVVITKDDGGIIGG